MRKGKKRLLMSLLSVALVMACCFGFSMNSYAYWFFGTVGVSLGKTSVSLTSGQSEAVSITLTPASSDQLPGCGMEECPRICGDKNCYNNEYGQCICNGSTLTTYYPTATVSSDNTSVATATYNGGAVTITGVGEGKATITVVGSLRQYYDSPEQTIAVTVSANTGGYSASIDTPNQSSSGNSSNSGSADNSGNSAGSSGDTVVATQVDGTENAAATGDAEGEIEEIEEEENTEEDAEEDDGITKVESDKGTIWFVPITGLPQGKEQFEEIQGDESQYVDFQLKDDAGNVVYAWEFWGSDINEARDMTFTIESSREPFEGCSYGSSDNSLYLHFLEEGEFVGKATISYRVSDYFPNDAVLNLYRYNPEDDTVELVAEGLAIDNGYVNMELDRGGYYILTTEDFLVEPEEEEEVLEEPEKPEATDEIVEEDAAEPEVVEEQNTGLSAGAIAAIVIIAAAVAALIIFLVVRAVRKRKNGDGNGAEEGIEEGTEEGAEEGAEAEMEEAAEEGAEAETEEAAEEGAEAEPEEEKEE